MDWRRAYFLNSWKVPLSFELDWKTKSKDLKCFWSSRNQLLKQKERLTNPMMVIEELHNFYLLNLFFFYFSADIFDYLRKSNQQNYSIWLIILLNLFLIIPVGRNYKNKYPSKYQSIDFIR